MTRLGRWLSIPLLLALPATITAEGFDCKEVLVDKQTFDLSALGGIKTVHKQEVTDPTVRNTTFAINICDKLKRNTEAPDAEQCEDGARVCGVEQIWKDGKAIVTDEVINIAGNFMHHNLYLDPKPELLREKVEGEDDKVRGVRITFHGGRYPFKKRPNEKQMKQKAVIDFVCNKTVTGNEKIDDDKLRLRRADDDDDDSDDPFAHLPHPDAGKSIQFESYEAEDEDTKVLKVIWQTQYACIGSTGDEKPVPPERTKGGWGFFTWFFFIVFLLAAAYIIFGSWLNYNRYGARGWDLIPHGDTIRDLPYIIKDFFSNMMGKLQGGGSRGGYSAV